MAQSEVEKKIDEWVQAQNKHIGEEIVPWPASYPVEERNIFGQQAIEWVTEDIIRHYCASMGDRNPLYWSHDYARRTRWGGIIAPPCFTDSICISWTTKREPPPVPWVFPTLPSGNKREWFGVFRPGDRIRLIDKYLGVEERKAKEPRPYRTFFDISQRSFINQNDQVVALVTYRYVELITTSDPAGQRMWRGSEKKERYKFTDEEIDAIIRGYEANKRRGAETLYWEDVNVGDEVPTLAVGPFSSGDSVAFFSAQQGHTTAFDIGWERAKTETMGARQRDPETNTYGRVGEGVHVSDGSYGFGFGLGYQFEGLLARMLTDWIGDDGFVKVLDCQSRALPILGDAFYQKGKVTGKRVEDGEHLVDLDIRTDNQTGELIERGTATVRLLSRTA